LVVLMLMCSNIFSSATRAWVLGSTRVEQNTIGRAVLDTMARDLSHAVVSTTMVFRAQNSLATWSLTSVYGRPQSQTYSVHFICMMSYQLQMALPDEMIGLHYFVREVGRGTPTNRYQLCRAEGNWNANLAKNVYEAPATWLNRINNIESRNPTNNIFAENITAFKVMINGTNSPYMSDTVTPPVNRHKLPYFADIYLGVLSDDDARKAALLSGAEQQNFVTRNERRFVQRVYFRNRDSIPAATVPP